MSKDVEIVFRKRRTLIDKKKRDRQYREGDTVVVPAELARKILKGKHGSLTDKRDRRKLEED